MPGGAARHERASALGASRDELPVSAIAEGPHLVARSECAGFAAGPPEGGLRPDTRVLLSVGKAGWEASRQRSTCLQRRRLRKRCVTVPLCCYCTRKPLLAHATCSRTTSTRTSFLSGGGTSPSSPHRFRLIAFDPGMSNGHTALTSLYESAGGIGWTQKTNWMSQNDVCTWQNVQCVGGVPNGLDLDNRNLQGTLPTQLAFLGEGGGSINFELEKNSGLVGYLPTELASMTLSGLHRIFLDNTQISGTIPTEYGRITAGQGFQWNWYSMPKVSGTLPDFSKLQATTGGIHLYFPGMKLSGTLPREFSSMNNESNYARHDLNFNVAGSSISGTLPTEIGNLNLGG